MAHRSFDVGYAAPPLTPREAARRLGVSGGTVRRWLSEGRLEGVRVGGRYRIDAAELERFAQPAAQEETKCG